MRRVMLEPKISITCNFLRRTYNLSEAISSNPVPLPQSFYPPWTKFHSGDLASIGELGQKLVKALLDIHGVGGVKIERNAVEVSIGGVDNWDEVQPIVIKILREVVYPENANVEIEDPSQLPQSWFVNIKK